MVNQTVIRKTLADAQVQKNSNLKQVVQLRQSVTDRWFIPELQNEILTTWSTQPPGSIHTLAASHMMTMVLRDFPSKEKQGASLATICVPELLDETDPVKTGAYWTHPGPWIDMVCRSHENTTTENQRMKLEFELMTKSELRHRWFAITMESYRSFFLLQAAQMIMDHSEMLMRASKSRYYTYFPAKSNDQSQASPYFDHGMQTERQHVSSFSNESWLLEFIPIMADAMNGDQEAVRQIQECAEQEKNAIAQHYLGRLYASGAGDALQKSPKDALAYYKLASKAGYAVAQDDLGMHYWEKRKAKKAKKWLEKSAKAGYIRGQVHLADIYAYEFDHNGAGFKSLKKALNWYMVAANNVWYSSLEEDYAILARNGLDQLKDSIQAQIHKFITYDGVSFTQSNAKGTNQVRWKRVFLSTGKFILIFLLSILASLFVIFLIL